MLLLTFLPIVLLFILFYTRIIVLDSMVPNLLLSKLFILFFLLFLLFILFLLVIILELVIVRFVLFICVVGAFASRFPINIRVNFIITLFIVDVIIFPPFFIPPLKALVNSCKHFCPGILHHIDWHNIDNLHPQRLQNKNKKPT